jgi:iron complex outermembrane receptor protein
MKLSTNWNTNFALHYTKGKGFYENYKEMMDFLIMVLQPVGGGTTTDLVRQNGWIMILRNHFQRTTRMLN